jgi:hypothetical protein
MPVVWSYPLGPLPPHVAYSVEIEADDYGVTVMVARDAHDIPYGIAVAFGDEPLGLGEVLAIWDIEFPWRDSRHTTRSLARLSSAVEYRAARCAEVPSGG